MKKEDIKTLYEMMYNLNKIAEDNRIRYFLFGSTLESVVKFKGIIPDKNKIYVGFLKEDLGKILNILSLFSKCGYRFNKPKSVQSKQTYSLTKGNVSVIMVMFRKWGQTYKIDDWEVENDFSNSTIKKSDLLPLKKVELGVLSLKVPKKYKRYLEKLGYKKVSGKPLKLGKIKKQTCSTEKKLSKDQIMDKIPIEKLSEGKKVDYKDCTITSNGEKIVSFYINCEVHKDRRNKFLKYLKKAKGVKSRREPCVNGREITNNIACQMVKYGFVDKKADVTPIEIAIFLSHYNIWIKLLNSDMDYSLVFEDDSEIHPGFKEMLDKTLRKLGGNFDVLFLWNGNWADTAKYGKNVLKVDDKISIFRETKSFTPGTVSYLITRKHAKKLVQNSFPIDNSVDVYMGEFFKEKSMSVKMTHNKEKGCYLSPFFTGEDWVCGGEWGTGDTTTQNYDADKVYQIKCGKIN